MVLDAGFSIWGLGLGLKFLVLRFAFGLVKLTRSFGSLGSSSRTSSYSAILGFRFLGFRV